MFRGWLRRFLSSTRRSSSRPRPYRSQLEALEDRLLLAGTATPTGLVPAQMLHAYGIDQIRFNPGNVAGDGTGQTIAIITGGDNPNVAADLQAFDQHFGLPDPAFTKVMADGSTNFPPVISSAWATEDLLDVEWAHAVAPGAKILLVEALPAKEADAFASFVNAVDYARKQPGVSVVSMSYGQAEFAGETSFDSSFTTPAGHAPITFVAATGDHGSALYPALSPNVLAVGGTTLNVDSAGKYLGETGWSGSGGGLSQYEAQPAFQKGVVSQSSTQRTAPDVAIDASTQVSIYDSRNGANTPWGLTAGTSLSAPLWAGLIAIANQGRSLGGLGTLDGPTQTLPLLYQLPAADFHDITTGNNGFQAGQGYDLVTGRGSPIANLLVPALAQTASPVPNSPVLTYASSNHTSTTILGTLSNQPFTTYTLQFSTSGSGSGTTSLVQTQVTTDALGNAGIYVYTTNRVTPGLSVTATATDPLGNTSQVSSAIPVVQSPNASANEAFVAQVYLDLLHRPADTPGLAAWENYLTQGGSRGQVVQGMINSPEYQGNLVRQLYLQFLHRPADSQGLAGWVTFLQAGNGVLQLEMNLLGSPEYYQLHGGTGAGFLSAVYQDVLVRPIDPFGQTTFLGQLGAGMSPATVAAELLTSSEASHDLVAADYQRFLHRAADNSGLNTWTNAVQQGLSPEQLLAGLVGSDEYFGAV